MEFNSPLSRKRPNSDPDSDAAKNLAATDAAAAAQLNTTPLKSTTEVEEAITPPAATAQPAAPYDSGKNPPDPIPDP